MQKYLLFDADNTLFDFDKASEVAFAETLRAFKIPQGKDTFSVYLKINKMCWEQLERGEISPVQIKSLRFQLFLEAVNAEGNPLAINDFYLNRLGEKDYLLSGVREMLQRLKNAGYSLSIITNGLQLVQRPRIEKAGLTQMFDAITVSEEIGCAKPYPEFFADTFRQLNYPPAEETVVIGDNLLSDILGGKNIGANTIWFNPHGKDNLTEISPDYTAASITELEKIILSL